MGTDDLEYIEDLRTYTGQDRPSSAIAVGELLRIVDDLRQTVGEVSAERDALRKTMAVERKLWDECGDAQVRLTAERDEARAHYVAIVAERDALAAWKAAVPKTALLESLQLTASAAQYLAAAIWIESLDGSQ